MAFTRKTKVTFRPVAEVIEKVMKEEMKDGCISYRVFKEVMPKTNGVPYSHGSIHHYSITGEPLRQVSTNILTPDRFDDLSSLPDANLDV